MRELSGILWQKLYKPMQRHPYSKEYKNEFYQFIHSFQNFYPHQFRADLTKHYPCRNQ